MKEGLQRHQQRNRMYLLMHSKGIANEQEIFIFTSIVNNPLNVFLAFKNILHCIKIQIGIMSLCLPTMIVSNPSSCWHSKHRSFIVHPERT